MSRDAGAAIDLLGPLHDRTLFDCGHTVLNHYLKTQATQDIRRDLAQTYVMAQKDGRVVGYYTLSASMIEHAQLPEAARKKLPRYPIPAALLGRLAVDMCFQRKGLAKILLRDALHRALAMSKALGIYAVVVDAKNDAAVEFYRKFGFLALTDSSLHLYLPIKTITSAI